MEPDFGAMGLAFGVVLLAELGDKTQMALLGLSSRFRRGPLFAGAALGFAILTVLAVVVGTLLEQNLPIVALRYGSAILFAVLGAWTLWRAFAKRGDEEEERTPQNLRSGILVGFLATALGELGDKTQLSTVALAARFEAPISIAWGAFAALVLAAGLAILVGAWLAARLSLRSLQIVSGVAFLLAAGLALLP